MSFTSSSGCSAINAEPSERAGDEAPCPGRSHDKTRCAASQCGCTYDQKLVVVVTPLVSTIEGPSPRSQYASEVPSGARRWCVSAGVKAPGIPAAQGSCGDKYRDSLPVMYASCSAPKRYVS
jgi:hypothetical protein